MRRSSLAMGPVGEPLIVVEETGAGEETDSSSGGRAPRGLSVDLDSPPEPYLLSPWRDTRKHSLPTPACTSGPTASQVRRLSERGEGAAKEAREAAFLATLSQPTPQPGGRRHSVVTICRVPQALFGRGRRESIAAFPALSRSRRDSGVGVKCPPTTENLGSTHNLQLDIMDDIVTARKVRMRLWNTSSERLCEVQPLEERAGSAASGSSVRYTQRGRRHSDFLGSPLPPIPARRRASEMPPPIPPRAGASGDIGIVCTDTDLHLLLDALTSSATEIDRCGERPPAPETRRRLADARSSSFDASTLRERLGDPSAGWFARRHQTLAVKKKGPERQKTVTFAKDAPVGDAAEVVWDRPTGSVVDAGALGSAIEVFLRKNGNDTAAPTTSSNTPPPPPPRPAKGGAKPTVPPRPTTKPPVKNSPAGGTWYPEKPPEEEGGEGCDASLCSTLKDLFVK